MFRLCALFVALALCSCGRSIQLQQVLDQSSPDLPPAAGPIPVPFSAQAEHECGPAALAMALNWSGSSVTPSDLTPQVYLPDRKGTLQLDLVGAGRRNGRAVFPLQPKLRELLSEVASGNPPIVLLNLGLSWLPVWHYAIVIGYSLPDEQILIHSGRQAGEKFSIGAFNRTWERAGRWAILVLPADRVPTTVDRATVLRSILALEAAGQLSPSESAYRAALQRWPGDPEFQFALGNLLYQQQRLTEAEGIFAELTENNPHSATALNNYAEALSALGKDQLALTIAARASAEPGKFRPTALRTFREISAKFANNGHPQPHAPGS